MAKDRHNVTLVLDEELLQASRKIALAQGTSLNQLVRQLLTNLVEDTGRRRLARERLRAAFKKGVVEIGPRTWTRDDLHER